MVQVPVPAITTAPAAATRIEDDVFIGSDTRLIAPVTVDAGHHRCRFCHQQDVRPMTTWAGTPDQYRLDARVKEKNEPAEMVGRNTMCGIVAASAHRDVVNIWFPD
jgi:hypothetical protein